MLFSKSVKSVTPSEANDFISEENPVILDVRTPQEFAVGHIEGAINLPVGQLDEAIAQEFIGGLDTPVLVYCKSGIRSLNASKILVKMGYDNVRNLSGGIDKWPFGIVL